MTAQLGLEHGISAGHGTLTASGEIDMATAPELQTRTVELIAAATIERLTIDLTQVTFVDSSGLRALLAIKKSSDGIAVNIIAHARLRRVFEITKLGDELNVTFDDADNQP